MIQSEKSLPKVSVAIPTYNRASDLERCIQSVLEQDYHHIEVIVSDNDSRDRTQDLCLQLRAEDNRIHYFRQPYNRGPTANFVDALGRASGEYFMWLGDDDWIDRAYISRCVEELSSHPDCSLVCGVATYHQDRCSFPGEMINLQQKNRLWRMILYYSKVSRNGAFYGLMRRHQLAGIQLGNLMGGDWLFVAAVAFMGRIKTIQGVSIHRHLGGATESYDKMAKSLSLTRSEARFPHAAIAIFAIKDILWWQKAFKTLKKSERLIYGLPVFAVVLVWRWILPGLVQIARKIWKQLPLTQPRCEKPSCRF